MGIRQFKPVTKGTRFRSVSDFSEITRTTPEKVQVLTGRDDPAAALTDTRRALRAEAARPG